ncbi:MAG: trehalose-phosphatase [Marmoricola sp.]
MELTSPDGAHWYRAVTGDPAGLLVGLDFDGTLAPIVPDPSRARAHPDALEVLAGLATRVRAVAVVTGRPVAQVLELGRIEEVADRLGDRGEIHVLGQYGAQRWSSTDRRVVSPPPPAELAELRARLPQLLAEAGCPDAWVEDKGLALAVHTRRLPDPAEAFDRLLPVLSEWAGDHGLAVEPGRLVVEVRAGGTDKGDAVRRIVEELDARGVVFAGDDLGDVEAFRAVRALRQAGTPGLLVCSGSDEQTALVELADVVVDGPAGVVDLLRTLDRDLAAIEAG